MIRRITTHLLTGLICIATVLPMATVVTVSSVFTTAQDAQACPMRRRPSKMLVKNNRRRSRRSAQMNLKRADRLYTADNLKAAYPLYRGIWRQLKGAQKRVVLERLSLSAMELNLDGAAIAYARHLVRQARKSPKGYRLLVQALESRDGAQARAEMKWASRKLAHLEAQPHKAPNKTQVVRRRVALKTKS